MYKPVLQRFLIRSAMPTSLNTTLKNIKLQKHKNKSRQKLPGLVSAYLISHPAPL